MAQFEFYFLTENYESYNQYMYLTAMASRRSPSNRRSPSDLSFIGGMAQESAVNRRTKSLIAL